MNSDACFHLRHQHPITNLSLLESLCFPTICLNFWVLHTSLVAYSDHSSCF